MLIAILSDIHGNMEALKACWQDLAGFPVEHIISMGDMVGYGPDPDDVLNWVRQHQVLCLLGNHEWGVSFPEARSWFNHTALMGLERTKSLISADNLEFIAALPRYLLLQGARFVHGFPPDSVTTYLFQMEEKDLTHWFTQGEPLTFVGHTHELILVKYLDKCIEQRELGQEVVNIPCTPCIFNVGSVGQPRDGNNQAKYLLWDTLAKTVEIRFVPYDIARTVEKIRQRGFPEFYGSRLW